MPLSIPLPAGAKIIINGAVIQNSGSANITLAVHNKANILRDKDVLTQKEADTPAKEIYHSIQNAYLFESNRQEWLALSQALLERFHQTWPDSAPTIAHIRELMVEDKLYNALRASRRLIALETGEALPPGPGHEVEAEPRAAAARPAPKGRQTEIVRIKDQIAELEKRIAALDQTD